MEKQRLDPLSQLCTLAAKVLNVFFNLAILAEAWMENFLWAKIGTYLGRLKSDFGTLQEYKRTLSKSAKSLQLSTNWKYNFRSESSANLGKCNSLWAVGWQEIEKGRCCRHCSLANVALPTEDRPPGKQIHLCAKILRKYMFKKLFLIHHQHYSCHARFEELLLIDVSAKNRFGLFN